MNKMFGAPNPEPPLREQPAGIPPVVHPTRSTYDREVAEVKDKLKQSGLSLSGGQQQRLCIARAIATDPEVILMDEPCSALDPRSTLQIEELMLELKQNYTIIIVTHNMQQAARASDYTVFMNMADDRAGFVVEEGPTLGIFTNPKNQLTEDYVSGRFG